MSERQKSRSRVSSTGSSAIPQIEVQAPPRVSTTKRVPRDTGFPEPFHSGPNTTLPHPDADLSPHATLSCEDVSAERLLKTHRLSFLKKNRRTVSHGTLDPHTQALHSIVSNPALTADGGKNPSTTSLVLSRDGEDSVHSGSKKGDDDTPPTSPDVSEHRRKSGLFRRWKRK
ncbi:hypothetical protein E4U41_003842 [Claviceps citrina]|nr:hypothetical protein E4U41_003842 [Claviceps citrina]